MLLPSASGFSPHPPVSVYGTGTTGSIAAFLGTCSARFPTLISVHLTPSPYSPVLPWLQLLSLYAAFLSAPVLPTCFPTFLTCRSTGISTCFPSTTAFALALGPDLPRADQLYSGILGFSAWGIPTPISLLIPAFSLPYSPLLLPVQLPPVCNAPLPISLSTDPSASVSCFSPGHFRRRTS